jgi:hypothetical protein
LLSHIPNFKGVKVNPKEKYFDTSGVEVVGATGVRVEDPPQVVGNEIPQKNNPL